MDMGEYLKASFRMLERESGFMQVPRLFPPALAAYCAATLVRPGGGATPGGPAGPAPRMEWEGPGDLVVALIPADGLTAGERQALAAGLAEWSRRSAQEFTGGAGVIAVFLFAAGGEAALPEVAGLKEWDLETGLGVLPWLVDLQTGRVFSHPGAPSPPPGMEALALPLMDDSLPAGGALALPGGQGSAPVGRGDLSGAAPRFPVTMALLVLIGLAFGWLETQGGSTDSMVLIRWGANYRPLIVLEGQYWRLLTAVFLHAGIAHLAMNSLVLYHMGRLVEALFGSWRFLAIFLLSGLSGSLASLILGYFDVPSVGASGALFGLFGAMVYFRMTAAGGWRMPWSQLLWPIAINLSVGLLLPNIDNWAHVGGLVGGLVAGFLVGLPGRRFSSLRTVSLTLAGLLALLLLLGTIPVSDRGRASLVRGYQALEAGNYGEAEAHLRRAAELAPRDPRPHLYLALLFYHTGRPEAARAEAQLALDLDPQNPVAREILDQLSLP